MDPDQKDEQAMITFTEFKQGEETHSLKRHLVNIYPTLATTPEASKMIACRAPNELFPAILETVKNGNGHILRVWKEEGDIQICDAALICDAREQKEVGFVSYEEKEDGIIHFHASPIEAACRLAVFKKAVAHIVDKYPQASQGVVDCPPFLKLHDFLIDVGFQSGSTHEQNPNFPKLPTGKMVKYWIDLEKFRS